MCPHPQLILALHLQDLRQQTYHLPPQFILALHQQHFHQLTCHVPPQFILALHQQHFHQLTCHLPSKLLQKPTRVTSTTATCFSASETAKCEILPSIFSTCLCTCTMYLFDYSLVHWLILLYFCTFHCVIVCIIMLRLGGCCNFIFQ